MRSESRSKYLIFAMRIRKLTDSLIDLVERGTQTADLNARLKEVLVSLESSGQPTSVRSLRERGAFGHYETALTMGEVVKVQDKAELINRLNEVMNSQEVGERRRSALDAINFFDALESRALYHYNHPSPRLATHK